MLLLCNGLVNPTHTQQRMISQTIRILFYPTARIPTPQHAHACAVNDKGGGGGEATEGEDGWVGTGRSLLSHIEELLAEAAFWRTGVCSRRATVVCSGSCFATRAGCRPIAWWIVVAVNCGV